MTHTGPLCDSDGTFGSEQSTNEPCRQCRARTVTACLWESNDGAYEDWRFTCLLCGHIWWVDGIDS